MGNRENSFNQNFSNDLREDFLNSEEVQNDKDFTDSDNLKLLGIDTQTFGILRNNNYLYIDKTKEILEMVKSGRIYFLSRPRRFGKSLLVSTLEELFKGNKKLFKGLYIYGKWDWSKKYPIIHLDLSKPFNEDNKNFKNSLNFYVDLISEDFSIELEGKYPNDKLTELILRIHKKYDKKVVVLVDEYDAPILDNISNSDLVDANRKTLQSFYQALKNSDEYIEFIFITGISKFIHTSIFSKLNNPRDITLLDNYSTICGITHEELEKYCNDHIQIFANKNNIAYDEVLSKINYWYDGYSFDGKKKVFNPFSTLSALKNNEFSHYWFSTGTPHFLVDILKNRYDTIDFNHLTISEKDLNEIDPMNIENLPLLFQGGYLTIDKKLKNEMFETEYTLKIPNFEVEQAYKDNLVNFYLSEVEEDIIDSHKQLWEDIKNGDGESLADYLEIQFGEIPYYLNLTNKRDRWKLKQTIFLTLLKHLGFKTKGEVAISQGRIDATFRDRKHVVVCEVKYTQDPRKSIGELVDEALSQIHEKQYYRLYLNKKFVVILLALAFKDVQINEKDVLTEVKCKIEKISSKN
ncbi:MAG: ATPase AAA [Methanobrevibacter sp. CfCl-M3]